MGSRSRFACSCVPPCGSLWVSRVVGLGLGTSTACRSCTGMSNMGRQPACSKGGRTPQLLLPVACLKKTFRKRPSSLAAESILPELPFSQTPVPCFGRATSLTWQPERCASCRGELAGTQLWKPGALCSWFPMGCAPAFLFLKVRACGKRNHRCSLQPLALLSYVQVLTAAVLSYVKCTCFPLCIRKVILIMLLFCCTILVKTSELGHSLSRNLPYLSKNETSGFRVT